MVFDWDGVLVKGASSWRQVVTLKNFLLRYAPLLHSVGEILEAFVLKSQNSLCDGALEIVLEAKRRGMVVGIATDRSLFSLVLSAERLGLDLSMFDFIQCRRHALNHIVWARVPTGTRIIETGLKREPGAFVPLMVFLAMNRVFRKEVLVVDDDDWSVMGALQQGFHAIRVERDKPDFSQVWAETGFLESDHAAQQVRFPRSLT